MIKEIYWLFIYLLTWRQAYILINFILYIDLYNIIKDPFTPQLARMKYYLIFFFIYITTWAFLMMFNSNVYIMLMFNSVAYLSAVCFVLSFIILMIVLTRLRGRGDRDKDIHKKIVIRYALIFFIFLPDYIENFAINNEYTYKYQGFSYLFYFAGIWSFLIAVVRFSEPHIWTTLKNSFLYSLNFICRCRKYKSKGAKM